MNLDAGIELLSDKDIYVELFSVAAGFAGAMVAQNATDSRVDLPDEVYGVAVAVGNEAVTGGEFREVSIGAVLHTVDALARRANVRSTVMELGA